ncbi:alkyl hydroperoxide reductase [Neptunitalea chrysea]|uniref:Alkyl hydroperoxide reductase n=1 Tax=Neptunitalea chrysea TaxID=1647581 RepID=A0A9W6B8X3_9FLAO|nr:TlpA disulfide reductase family protein [Neptunitalea chrysea]GLB54030.1 alkyl hydroperoxide reductase [Neptunitalea chrysea]
MLKKFLYILFVVSLTVQAQKTTFSKEALEEKMTAIDGSEITFGNILKKYEGKVIVLDIWASWCSDCIKGMPKVKKLQEAYKNSNTVFVFMSLDRAKDSWKKGIERFSVIGEHYFIDAGWKPSAFCKDIELDWIPRYMIIDKTGKIAYYKAIKANDEQFINYLKSLQ